jgi:hypothetical protein
MAHDRLNFDIFESLFELKAEEERFGCGRAASCAGLYVRASFSPQVDSRWSLLPAVTRRHLASVDSVVFSFSLLSSSRLVIYASLFSSSARKDTSKRRTQVCVESVETRTGDAQRFLSFPLCFFAAFLLVFSSSSTLRLCPPHY